MTLEKFLEKYKHLCDYSKKDTILVEWCVGGMSGGSYGPNDIAEPYVSDDVPEELTAFDEILLDFVPDISYLKYKVIRNKCVIDFSRCDNSDYYGNSTNYNGLSCDLKTLYACLVEYGAIKCDE